MSDEENEEGEAGEGGFNVEYGEEGAEEELEAEEAPEKASEEEDLSSEEENYAMVERIKAKEKKKPQEKVRKPPIRPLNKYDVYTFSRVLRERTREIASGKPIYTNFDPTKTVSAMQIAVKELSEKRLPYAAVIVRDDGQVDLVELWNPKTRGPK